jgi:hypothetical protein
LLSIPGENYRIDMTNGACKPNPTGAHMLLPAILARRVRLVESEHPFTTARWGAAFFLL